MDSLKLLLDLHASASVLPSPFLRHLFHSFNPESSKVLEGALAGFHQRYNEGAMEEEESDIVPEAVNFRSACSQFTDWLYGWSVTEPEKQDSDPATPLSDMERMEFVKVPRELNLSSLRSEDYQEGVRISETFKTQFSFSWQNFQSVCFSIQTQTVVFFNDKKILDGEKVDKQAIKTFFYHVSIAIDYCLSCLISCFVVICFAEVQNNMDNYEKYMIHVGEICNMFVKIPLKVSWKLIEMSFLGPAKSSIYSYLNQAVKDPKHSAHEILNSFAVIDGQSIGLLSIIMRNFNVYQLLCQESVVRHAFTSIKDSSLVALRSLPTKVELCSLLLAAADFYLFPKIVFGHKNGVKCIQPCSFDVDICATSGYDGIVRIWDLKDSKCIAQYVGHKSIVPEIHFTKKETFIVSCSFDKTLRIWNSSSAALERTLIGHQDCLTTCDVLDGKYVVTGSLDMTMKLWEFESGELISSVKKHSKYIKQVVFTPDGKYVISAALDRRIYVWDLKILAFSSMITYYRCIDDHSDAVLAIDVFKPSFLCSVSRDHTVRLWDYLMGTCFFSFSLSPSWACCVAFNHDGSLFAAGCFDNTVHLFSVKQSQRKRVLKIFGTGILSVKFPESPSNFVLCGTADGFVQKLPLN